MGFIGLLGSFGSTSLQSASTLIAESNTSGMVWAIGKRGLI